MGNGADFMKKLLFSALIAILGFEVFTQEISTVAVAPFEPVGGISKDEANVITELFMAELVNTGVVKVADRANFDKVLAEMKFQLSDWSNDQKTAQLGRAINAEYIIYGQFMKMGNMLYLAATMQDINTVQRLYSSREQFQDYDQIFVKIPSFCSQIVSKIPKLNFFIGRWRSGTSITLDDNYYHSRPNFIDLTCEVEFKSDGTLIFYKYDNGGTGIDSNGDKITSCTATGTGKYEFNNEILYVEFKISPTTNMAGSWSGSVTYQFDLFKRRFYLGSYNTSDGSFMSIFRAFSSFPHQVQDKSDLYYRVFSKID
jgi:TolB-like protein